MRLVGNVRNLGYELIGGGGLEVWTWAGGVEQVDCFWVIYRSMSVSKLGSRVSKTFLTRLLAARRSRRMHIRLRFLCLHSCCMVRNLLGVPSGLVLCLRPSHWTPLRESAPMSFETRSELRLLHHPCYPVSLSDRTIEGFSLASEIELV